MVVPPIGVIALIRQRSGVRSGKEGRAALLGAIRTIRMSGNRQWARSTRGAARARLRVFVAEVERKLVPPQERLEKRSSSCRHHQPQSTASHCACVGFLGATREVIHPTSFEVGRLFSSMRASF